MTPEDRATVELLRHEESEPLSRLGAIVNQARLLRLEAEDLKDERLRIAAHAIEGTATRQWNRLTGRTA